MLSDRGMEVRFHVNVVPSAHTSSGPPSVAVKSEQQVEFKVPQALKDASFPPSDGTFQADFASSVASAAQLRSMHLQQCADNFMKRQNVVVYAYGQQGTPKRQALFGSGGTPADNSLVHSILKDLPFGKANFSASCYALTAADTVVDFLDYSNGQIILHDSVKEGPKVRNAVRQSLTSPQGIAGMLSTIVSNYTKHFEAVLNEQPRVDGTGLPYYNSDTIIFVLHRYDTPEAVDSGVESNSMHFIALGDSDRPVLCGLDAEQLATYEKTHRTLSAVHGVLSAIRHGRLRIPFGKSKLTSLLKRAYGAEKNNPNNEHCLPTYSLLLAYVFDDAEHAEEGLHTLSLMKRLGMAVGGGSIGPPTRDLGAEKWRLEQDIDELKDELQIARQVHNYQPCIYNQPKPVQNIHEEENKRIAAIRAKKEADREKARIEMRELAKKEAEQIIREEELSTNQTLATLQREVEEKRARNAAFEAERTKKIDEYHKHLEKIRKKKAEEETTANKLRDELKRLEDELSARQDEIAKQKEQLRLLNEDKVKGRENILREREQIKKNHEKLILERRREREQWLQDIKEINTQVLKQVALLGEERHKSGIKDKKLLEEDVETEAEVKEDIASIDRHLPELISIDGKTQDPEKAEKIRKQLEIYFSSEKENYQAKLQSENKRLEKLEKAAESYKARLEEQAARHQKEQLADAVNKEQHLANLVEQVVEYLEHGCKMRKVSSKGTVRRRFFFISDDRKKIHGCDVDDMGFPVSRKKPTTTVLLKDIKRVILGQYSQVFQQFAGVDRLKAERATALDDNGCFNNAATPLNITPENIAKYNYRSFTLELRKGKTLDLVSDSDSDCEAWLVGLKKLLGIKTSREKRMSSIADDTTATIEWGAPLDLLNRRGVDKLSAPEKQLCCQHHIAPMQYLAAKTEVLRKSNSCLVTRFDVRTLSSLDLLRCQYVHEFMIDNTMIPPVQ